MSVKEISDEDIIYVAESKPRSKILSALEKESDVLKLSELCNKINEKRGKINFHCKGLEKRGLLNRRIVSKKSYVKITEKGIKVIEEIRKRGKGKNLGKIAKVRVMRSKYG